MFTYLNLNRRFVEREKYDPDELVATEITGKRLDWLKVGDSRVSVIVAPANFGKTTEMKHQAKQMRSDSRFAVFVALRRVADRGNFEKALESDERVAYLAWKAAGVGTLTLFVDSLDEASAGKREGIENLVSDIAAEVAWPNDRVQWIISTRPAVLTTEVLVKLTEILIWPSSITMVRASGSPSTVGSAATTTEASVVSPSGGSNRLSVFSMVPLDIRQAEIYLGGRHAGLSCVNLLRTAHERGLSGFTKSPGGLDILASIDLISNPPDSLTEVFHRVVKAVQAMRGVDHRLQDVGNPDPAMLEQAAWKLASASQVCQLVNIEMPEETLAVPEKALSARLIVPCRLTERAINQLLNSQLFIDAGFHQVKMYPDELTPFLAAQRLSELAQSPDQAHKLMRNFTWSASTGEQGVHRQFLPLMGWLATLNPHCREEILKCDPQALAFFGDLRNSAVPLAAAKEALTTSIRRLVEQGDHLGRGMFNLTSENFWQAGPSRLVPLIKQLFDRYGSHPEARDALMNIATASRSDALRGRVLRACGHRYERLLAHSSDVRYLLDLAVGEDLDGLAEAIKTTSSASESLTALLINRLGWARFTPSELVRLVDKQFRRGEDGFHIGYVLESGGLLESASDQQLYQLCRGLVIRVARLRDRPGRPRHTGGGADGRYEELTTEVVAALVKRPAVPDSVRTARLCLVLQRVLFDKSHGTPDASALRQALQDNTRVRRALLLMVVGQAASDENKLWRSVFGYDRACVFVQEDIEEINDHILSKVHAEEVARAAQRVAKQPKQSGLSRKESLKVDAPTKRRLRATLDSLRDGTATNWLAWIAGWLLQTNPKSRYGEVNFDVFEREAGKVIAAAVREGLAQVWRKRQPQFKEDEPRSTYYITAAGLQGLHLELGDGEALLPLSEVEVRQALRYGAFEINGYPRWFWRLAGAHQAVAADELSTMIGQASSGAVSREHAEELLTGFDQAPAFIRRALAPLAWTYLVRSQPSREYVVERILHAVMEAQSEMAQGEFERTASVKIRAAFKAPIVEVPDAALEVLRSEGVVWAAHWLTSFPASFHKAVSKWGPRDPDAVRLFVFRLAAYFGRDRGGELVRLARASDAGVIALEALYQWTMWAVRPEDDVVRPDGVSYSPGARDNAEQLRDGLIPAIASAKSQQAYEVLGRLRGAASGSRELYLRRVQFEMREAQHSCSPLPQTKYDQFELDLTADVTDSVSFAMTTHSDLRAIKYDIERGEFSLRRFFSELDFGSVNKKGPDGDKAALALEADFQQLLASELNHHARGRYTVTVESHTAEAKRRDVLCSRGDWHISIELKMSMRWSLDDYLEALEKQLVGQYMRHRKATTGFLVLVLQQKGRQWKNSDTGKMVQFDEVLSILNSRAQALEAKNRSRYLRVIGIDATAPDDFRKKGKGPSDKEAGKVAPRESHLSRPAR